VLAAIADSGNYILTCTLLAIGSSWTRIISNAFWLIIALLLCITFVPVHGALGLVYALTISQFAHLFLQYYLVTKSIFSSKHLAAGH
jgi:hypothetical protein